MPTIATLLSGGELVGIGARNAGLSHLWGIEKEDNIATVARKNGFDVITSDVLDVDPYTLEIPDMLHVSTVCTNASQANQTAELNEDGTKESNLDLAVGEKVAQFIDAMKPRIFTLENVFQYRHFKAFKIICSSLNRNGYMWDFDNLNSADFGVPQTRRRLILRAIRGSLLPMLPKPEKWVGWYEAIEDLIPNLPDSKFAKWQLERLPIEIKQSLLVDSAGYPDKSGVRVPVTRDASQPTNTIVVNYERRPMRAFILNGTPVDNGRFVTLPQSDEPIFTITASHSSKPLRAYLVDGQNAGRDLTILDQTIPACTISASGKSVYRALLVGGSNTQLSNPTSKARDKTQPAFTVFAGDNHIDRTWLSQGRVVRMTVRALCRFQSIPDTYKCPTHRIVGNAVPPLLYQKIIAPLAEIISTY